MTSKAAVGSLLFPMRKMPPNLGASAAGAAVAGAGAAAGAATAGCVDAVEAAGAGAAVSSPPAQATAIPRISRSATPAAIGRRTSITHPPELSYPPLALVYQGVTFEPAAFMRCSRHRRFLTTLNRRPSDYRWHRSHMKVSCQPEGAKSYTAASMPMCPIGQIWCEIRAYRPRSRGSRASRRASPKKAKLKTTTERAKPGKTANHGAVSR